jgi:hypothetical protein
MIFLPILFWCGYPDLGRVSITILATGVVISGILKDLLCLPRPVSPPLQRITMSGSAALEYGFPSTHSTNAVSVTIYAIYLLNHENSTLSPNVKLACMIASYLYAFTIALGRLYCGMHGFVDVITGAVIGASVTWVEIHYGPTVAAWVATPSITHLLVITAIMLVVVRTHPEPADNCPCFDDSVAFSGVLIGMYIGLWHVALPGPMLPFLPTSFFDEKILAAKGIPLLNYIQLVRIPLGVGIIVAWRSLTKPLLLRLLPPLFRVMEGLDLDLPRRYFLRASQYATVPHLDHDDNVLPSPRDVGMMLGNVRRRRGRAISVGPQSAADAHELLAYRQEERRRERSSSASSRREKDAIAGVENHEKAAREMVEDQKRQDPDPNRLQEESDEEEDNKERAVMFSNLPRVRVRYDVEVVTKLIVYAGIAWLALEGMPVFFHSVGLGYA